MAGLFHQQCWCWGYDIRHDGPNYLLEFGFRYTPRPDNRRGSSRYSMAADGRLFHIWAFGAAVTAEYGSDPLAICMRRYEKLPDRLLTTTRPENIHLPEQLDACTRKIAPAKLSNYSDHFIALIGLMYRYESFIETEAPRYHRRDSLCSWKHQYLPGPHMKSAWKSLHHELQQRHNAAA